jgi:hypothetical protein
MRMFTTNLPRSGRLHMTAGSAAALIGSADAVTAKDNQATKRPSNANQSGRFAD